MRTGGGVEDLDGVKVVRSSRKNFKTKAGSCNCRKKDDGKVVVRKRGEKKTNRSGEKGLQKEKKGTMGKI